jgi:hypothetical protein
LYLAANPLSRNSVGRAFITNISFDDDTVFVGRDTSLEQIESALWQGQGAAAITQAAAVHGLGGIGKTTLALEYARRNRHRYRGVWRVRSEQLSTMVHDLALLHPEIAAVSLKEDPRDAARAALDEMGRVHGQPYLLLFDNIESPDEMRAWWPARGAHVLITSRWGDWQASKARPIALETLTPAASTSLLLTLSNRTGSKEAAALSEKLGYLPLALSHAGAVLRRARALTFEDYARNLEAYIASAPKGAGEYPVAVRAAIESNLAMLARDSPDAEALLDIAAYCAPDVIPLSLWGTNPTRSALPASMQDAVRRAESFGALETWSLASLTEIETDTKELCFNLHRLTQAVIRAHCTEAGRNAAVLETTLEALEALAGDAAELPYRVMQKVNPHAAAVDAHIAEQQHSNDRVALLLGRSQALVLRTTLHCTFCFRKSDDVAKLIVAGNVGSGAICDGCVVRCEELFSDAGDTEKGVIGAFTSTGPFTPEPAIYNSEGDRLSPRCGFCTGEMHYALRKGDGVICDDCADLCFEILIEGGMRVSRKAPSRASARFSHNRLGTVTSLNQIQVDQTSRGSLYNAWRNFFFRILFGGSKN